MGTDGTTRTYRSPLRETQAELTRDRVIHAALALFERDGYAATSIAAVAREAGVAAETVYAAFHSKRGILQAMVDRADLLGAGRLLRTVWLGRAGQPAAQLEALVVVARDFWTANRQLLSVFRRGTGDSDLAEVWNAPQRGRLLLFRALLGGWPDGTLAGGLDVPLAAAILFALTSADVFQLLVDDAGWTSERYEEHVASLLRHALLPPGVPSV